MFSNGTHIMSPVFTTRDANLVDFIKAQHASAEQRTPVFQNEGLVKEVMAGLYIDPRRSDITFVTPASWVFHTLNFSAVCKFSIVCTNTMKAFSSTLVRELVLLYARFLQLSACFQDDHDCSMLLERLDNGYRQAVAFEEPQNLIIEGYSTDRYHLDYSRTIGFFEHFREDFDSVTLHSLIRDDIEATCALRTHQEGYYFNSIPQFAEKKSPEKIIRRLRDHVIRQEFLRFFSLLNVPVSTTHDIDTHHRLLEFINIELEKASALRKKLQMLSDTSEYQIPVINTKEYAKRFLCGIVKAAADPNTTTTVAASSSSSTTTTSIPPVPETAPTEEQKDPQVVLTPPKTVTKLTPPPSHQTKAEAPDSGCSLM